MAARVDHWIRVPPLPGRDGAATRAWSAGLGAAPALVFLLVIALLRDAEGGAASGFAPLVIFPLLWVSIYGSRRDLLLFGLGVAALFVVPAAFLDPAEYPDSEWRRAAIWVAATALVGLTVQDLVGDVRRRVSDLERISETSRHVARAEDLTSTVCVAVRAVLEADFVVLMEPAADGTLVATASSGLPLPDVAVRLDDPTSGAAQVLRSGERLLVADAASEILPAALTRSHPVTSALFEPVRDAAGVIAVAVAGFSARRRAVEPTTSTVLEILTGEAATAIARTRQATDLVAEAATDPLTGCVNRRFWGRYLPGALALAAREHRPVAVALLDIDDFKRLNDARGHQAGDEFLAAAARAWRGQLRASDVLARYGGDEFSVCLPDAGAEHATAAAERLRHSMPEGSACSIGVAVWDTSESPDSLVARADAALYRAKRSGGDRTLLA